jgi:EAL domain-containing protein (putative c-di-GMP-specific phosphodiesterase class I)
MKTFTERLKDEISRKKILELIDNDSLTVHFQPVFSAGDGSVYGYEALARIPFEDDAIGISELFKNASITGVISLLDVRCRENAISQAKKLGIDQKDAFLFINICPETLLDPAHRGGITDELVEDMGLSKERIIIEITEESAVKDYNLFGRAIERYRSRGYMIAIDDFGSGYGGLKMLSMIEPDFVKIDRYFISNIDQAAVNCSLVDSITATCHRMGIKVIAEGIEREEELNTVLNMGIEFLQGYYLRKPSPLLDDGRAAITGLRKKTDISSTNGEQCFIGGIAGRFKERCHRICGNGSALCFRNNKKQISCISDMVINKICALKTIVDMANEDKQCEKIDEYLGMASENVNELINWIRYLQKGGDRHVSKI